MPLLVSRAGLSHSLLFWRLWARMPLARGEEVLLLLCALVASLLLQETCRPTSGNAVALLEPNLVTGLRLCRTWAWKTFLPAARNSSRLEFALVESEMCWYLSEGTPTQNTRFSKARDDPITRKWCSAESQTAWRSLGLDRSVFLLFPRLYTPGYWAITGKGSLLFPNHLRERIFSEKSPFPGRAGSLPRRERSLSRK